LNLENYFISQFSSTSIGDDGAVLDSFVYSKDAFFEDVHFKLKWMNHFQIASKAMLINISDAIAMNAKPCYALLSVAMPKNITKSQMKELVSGFESAAKRYGVEIIGGDTISNTKLDISITIISKTKKPLLRSTMRKGHLLAYTGLLGNSAKDLKTLQNLGRIHKKSKFVNIKLRDKFVADTARFLSAGMDISDGLYSDLDKLASTCRVGFSFDKKIPKHIACSGEEYEMLISFDRRHRKAMIRRAKLSKTPLNIFAKSVRSKYTNRCKAHHF
jgi:thiamine-monophosphate kinase